MPAKKKTTKTEAPAIPMKVAWDCANDQEKVIQFSCDRGQLIVLTNKGRLMQHIRGGMWKIMEGPKL